jgi:Na+(H+)/acetate symporter ActP
MNSVEFGIVIALFVVVTVMGFFAARWRRTGPLHKLDEWGLGGRSFGTWITWFLLGGDLYTAYTFVAVPALVFGAGALGFFAVPYTIVVYPIVFLAAARLWSVAHRQGYVTAADFVRGRHGSNALGVAIALTGIVATMPYIALQMVGIQAVVEAIGINGHWPLVIAFVVLAAYTYSSGLRAPALIAFVKDLLIYAVVLVAVIYPLQARRIRAHLRCRIERIAEEAEQGWHYVAPIAVPGVFDSRARLSTGTFPLPTLDHRRASSEEPRNRQEEHVVAARLLVDARLSGPARIYGDRSEGRTRERQQRQA